MLAAPETPDGSEFVKHPDFRIVSAFFLGWVFYASFSALLTSLKLKGIVMKLLPRFLAATHQPSDSPAGRHSIEKLSVQSPMGSPISTSTGSSTSLQRTLIMMLFISFVTGSLANFGSLLSFGSNKELCAFSVAWGTLSTETARLMGLFVLLLTLRHLGMKRIELIVSLVWLMVGLVFVFIETALATGVTVTLRDTNLIVTPCYRRRFPAASIASTSVYLILELFVVVRLWFRIPQHQIYSEQKWARLWDARVIRALSLVVLNLLTAVPSAIVTNTLVESIPYSVGALGVLLAFAQEVDDWELSNKPHMPDLSPFCPLTSNHQISGLDNARSSPPTFSAWVPHHPYSSRSLSDPAMLQTWDDQRSVTRNTTVATARSTRTIDSRTARSIRNAVIQQARREKFQLAGQGEDSLRRGLSGDEEGASDAIFAGALEASESSGPAKPVRPKLVIVTRSPGPWPGLPAVHTNWDRSSRGLSVSPVDKISSRFSSPSVTTSEITYPSRVHSRVLSFSSTPNPTSEDAWTPPLFSQSNIEFDLPENREVAADPRTLATVSGPRPMGAVHPKHA
ncbi:hypothetical protein D9757_002767 [Collybiopsis confluens]|uniref:Uncharacterized protein n=1 Tax=Collybiopsis confluens TaxID=2823264 RepID=A0A8H5HW50_9AGAR|nr:hypothetical protein D9757_002767 [Collybiopsis confluens]